MDHILTEMEQWKRNNPEPDNIIEFWQGQPDRLHDRFLYQQQDDMSWTISRLAP